MYCLSCLRQSSEMSLGCVAALPPPGHPVSVPLLSVPPFSPCPDSPSRFPAAGYHRIGLFASPACSPRTWVNISLHRRPAGLEKRSPRGCTRGTGPAGSPGMQMRARERGRVPRCGHGAGAGGAAGRWSAGWSSPWQREVTGLGCPTASA